jgi:hypothetical protein
MPTVGLLVVVSIAAGFFLGRATGPSDAAKEGANTPTPVPMAKNTPQPKAQPDKVQLDTAPYKGAKDAPVVIYEVSDFQ